MIHLYYGDGKGKSTAAAGLALRALGAGQRVSVLAFLKDGSSGELAGLRALGARVWAGLAGLPAQFSWQMSEADKAACLATQTARLRGVLQVPCEMLVLDEACAAFALGLVDRDLLRTAVLQAPAGREVVLTGRAPAAWMLAAADYVTEMRAVRHPFDKGVPARPGVEY